MLAEEKSKRNVNLDAARGVACLIVFLGHLLFLRFDLNRPYWTNPIRLGATCVIFFFCLSGYVLTCNKRTSIDLKWAAKRLMRLMPIYYLSWSLPLFLMVVFNSRNLPDRLGIILGALGLQSFSSAHYLDQPNPPLWSLSIEIYLSLSLLIIARLNNKVLYITIALLSVISIFTNFIHTFPVLGGLVPFISGILIARKSILLSSRNIQIIGICIFLIGILTSDYLINGSGRLLDTYRIIFATATLLLISNLSPKLMANSFLQYLGSRSYVIYAVHWPVLNLLDHIFLNYEYYLFLKIIFYVFVCFFVVEIAYRYIEIPAIRLSRKLFG